MRLLDRTNNAAERASAIYHIFGFIEKPKLALLSHDVVYGFVTGRTMGKIVNFWSCGRKF